MNIAIEKKVIKNKLGLLKLAKTLGNGRAQVNLDPQSIEKIPCMSDPMFEGLKRKATTGF